mgnify:CR=1 FL=1
MAKILFVNTYYDAFLKDNPLRPNASYEDGLQERVMSRFGDSDFYSYWIGRSGWSSKDVIANDSVLQGRWAGENNCKTDAPSDVWKSQLKDFKPDVAYIFRT